MMMSVEWWWREESCVQGYGSNADQPWSSDCSVMGCLWMYLWYAWDDHLPHTCIWSLGVPARERAITPPEHSECPATSLPSADLSWHSTQEYVGIWPVEQSQKVHMKQEPSVSFCKVAYKRQARQSLFGLDSIRTILPSKKWSDLWAGSVNKNEFGMMMTNWQNVAFLKECLNSVSGWVDSPSFSSMWNDEKMMAIRRRSSNEPELKWVTIAYKSSSVRACLWFVPVKPHGFFIP